VHFVGLNVVNWISMSLVHQVFGAYCPLLARFLLMPCYGGCQRNYIVFLSVATM
jgi:hypothetical protein